LYRVGGDNDWPFAAARLLGNARRLCLLPDSIVSTLFLTLAVARIARSRCSVDLVHFHGDYLEALAAGAIRLFGIPSLLTLHGRLSSRVLRAVGFVYRFPSHIVAVSSPIVSQLEKVGVPPGRVTIQPSGVDSAAFYPSRSTPARRPFRVVVASTLIPLKDHGSLIDAVHRLRAEGVDVQLELAGAGPERARLEKAASPAVRFHGQLARPELARLMQRCHVAALASVDTAQAGEGTPTFLMEAIACGLPFVATDAGGVPALAARSQAGVIVPQRRPDALAAALKWLTTDEKEYERRRRAALAFGPSLSWDRVAKRLEALTEELVDRRKLPVRRS
jgi:glycosyltransferase involved in cell wall biosynthesis